MSRHRNHFGKTFAAVLAGLVVSIVAPPAGAVVVTEEHILTIPDGGDRDLFGVSVG